MMAIIWKKRRRINKLTNKWIKLYSKYQILKGVWDIFSQ